MIFDHEKICFSCEYCTSIYFPEESRDGIRATDEEIELACPVCKQLLAIAYAGFTRVSYCEKCRGILIRQPDFLPVIEYMRSKTLQPPVVPPPLPVLELQRKLTCPQCHQRMATHPYGGPGNVVIDNCARCLLIWLDHNELHCIIRAPDRF